MDDFFNFGSDSGVGDVNDYGSFGGFDTGSYGNDSGIWGGGDWSINDGLESIIDAALTWKSYDTQQGLVNAPANQTSTIETTEHASNTGAVPFDPRILNGAPGVGYAPPVNYNRDNNAMMVIALGALALYLVLK